MKPLALIALILLTGCVNPQVHIDQRGAKDCKADARIDQKDSSQMSTPTGLLNVNEPKKEPEEKPKASGG